MVKSLITLVLSTLRWTHWLGQYAVVYPLGMMMLLVVVVFWAGHNTPGQMLVKTIESVQREGYVIHDCTGPASREALNGDAVKPLLPPDLQEDCTTVSTDAAGYAAHIDQGYRKNILCLWLLMAMVFTGGSIVIGSTPRAVRYGYRTASQVPDKTIFAKSDVSQLKRVYDAMSPDERYKFARAIRENTRFRAQFGEGNKDEDK